MNGTSDLDERGAQAEFSVANGAFERVHNSGVELRIGQLGDAVHGEFQVHGGLIGAVGGHGVERIGDGDDASHQGNLIAFQAVGIAAAVDVLVMQLNSREHFL